MLRQLVLPVNCYFRSGVGMSSSKDTISNQQCYRNVKANGKKKKDGSEKLFKINGSSSFFPNS